MSPGWADLDRGLFSISVAAELAGLHPQTLRIYEREGLLDPARSAGGTRRYSRRDIDRLAEICALTADGLNLAGIRRVLALQEETRQLQAELARLRELARRQPPAQPPGKPRPPAPVRSHGRPGSAVLPVPLPEPLVQAGGQGTLGGQVVFQAQDPQRGGQGVALVEQLPDPGGEGQLAAGVAAAPARGPLRPHGAGGIQRAQERLLHPEHLGGPPGGVGRVVRVVQGIEPSGHRRYLRSGSNFQEHLTVSCSQCYIKSVSVIDLVMLPQVPGRVIGMTLLAREAAAAFADVVYADQQWVDAEFDALISASFSEPPAPPPPAPPRVPPPPGIPPPPSRLPVPVPADATSPATGPEPGRQRSPPAHPLTQPPGH